MRVKNMTSSKGNAIPNQFIITGEEPCWIAGEQQEQGDMVEYFQSYQSVIVKVLYAMEGKKIYLDRDEWDYSKTTGKYRNQFLGETKAETQKKIDSGEYILTDLN